MSLAIYIHWPFCKKKCPYCDFNSHVSDAVDHKRWAEVLKANIESFARLTDERQVSSVFFGGGTPSMMEADTVAACIEAVQTNWQAANDFEVTFEANPTSSAAQKFEAFRAVGVNRISVGVQSFDNDALKFLGREHSAEEAKDAITMARDIFPRASFDLIYGRPEQSLDQWHGELEQALAFNPDHISVYQLTIEEGTQFYTRHQRGDFIMPDGDVEAQFYDLTQDVLGAAGLPAYEVSNHAKQGEESRHNMSYWRYDDYVGVGPGAHGRFVSGGKRMTTRGHKAPEIWLEKAKNGYIGSGTDCGYKTEDIDDDTAFEEALMVGLRLSDGVDVMRLEEKTGQKFEDYIDARKLNQLIDEGYLLREQNRVMCTMQGIKTLNSLLLYLLG